MATLSFHNVIKRYGGGSKTGPKTNQVIHGVNAHINDGEFIVIVGPSGCGKSTLLRMVAGLEEVSEGQIKIGDRVVNDEEPADRDIAMVFQNYALYPHMTVYDNMAYGLRNAGVGKAEIDQRVNKAAGILELGQFLQRKPRELSGGQRQRVAMGRAIVRQPQVFLFDEPLSNLDAKLRAQTRLEIQKLHAELGVTSLFVTHDQVEAMTLAERMIVMNAGRMEQFGTPDEVYWTPATTFVASFIGSPAMNLMNGRLGDRGFVVGETNLPLAQDLLPQNQQGNALTLGVRPEHLTVFQEGGWPMKVEMTELLGAERLIYGKLADAAMIIVRINATDVSPKRGDTISVSPQTKYLHWFDAQGKRITR
jgi:sn-glycerol 3-phosphate transport system ATP-binding protein